MIPIWKLTRADYEKSYGVSRRNTTVTGGFSTHREAVETAMNRGLPVPADVLKDYPELVKE